MDIKILDSWLKDYLDTKASPKDLAKYLSLCGPSVERIKEYGKDSVYEIEVTTNRVDSASHYGIAREAAAILPRFGIKAKFKKTEIDNKKFKFVKKVKYLTAVVNRELCPRFTAVLIRNVKTKDSPAWIRERLEAVGVRSINNVVDISNYIMLALGQPVHTFDYDKIKGAKMTLRPSKKGEKITTLDNKVFTLAGNDIVIEDGEKRLIDLAGVMGGNLSAIDENTKNVLLFVQTYDPVRIRKTSMGLAQRTMAATIFEKGTDTELVAPSILNAIHLFEQLTGGTPENEILDIYPEPYKRKVLKVGKEFIEKRLGISIPNTDVLKYLTSLEFEPAWKGNTLDVGIPSFRSQDVLDMEDIVEEIARIYGYHNLPSELMTGKLTGRSTSPQFEFELKIKNILSGWGGCEVYTLSLVDKRSVDEKALKLKNPLGTDTEYMRISLMPSLVNAANINTGTFKIFHLFEISNVYIPRKNDIPEERMILAGVFEGYGYQDAKGIVEALLSKLNVNFKFELSDYKNFTAGKSSAILSLSKEIGHIGFVENSKYIYYEFDILKIFKLYRQIPEYKGIPKNPPQIEDHNFVFPEKTKIGEVMEAIKNSEKRISEVELIDVYKDTFTIRIWYQDPEKTLTDAEVEKIRNKMLLSVKGKFGGTIKV